MEEYFTIERDSGEPDSEGRLTYDAKMHTVSLELEEQLKLLILQAKKAVGKQQYDKRKREELYYMTILSALIAKQKQYPTSRSEDEVLLQNRGISKRHRMAVEVRLGEKKLLEAAIAMVGEVAIALTDAEEEPSAKRPRTAA